MTEHSEKIPITVICGPTACGKTRAAISLAIKNGSEIVSADSMQIYKGLDIGTAKPTPEERAAVPHHLIDFLDPGISYSVADYVKDAADAINNIHSRGKEVIVVGGTGLYISSLIKGVNFSNDGYDETIRNKLYERLRTEGIEALYAELAETDPEYAEKTHINNVKRVIRGLEIFALTGQNATTQGKLALPDEPPYQSRVLFLDFSDRAALYEAIDARVDKMVGCGLVEEAGYVYNNRACFITAAQAIGYKEFFPYFENVASLSDCISELKKSTRHYAKRQLSWFRAMDATEHVFVDINN